MLENYLIQIGLRCGTVKNFNTTIVNDMRKKDVQHWYFLTPIKAGDKGGLLKEAVVTMALPFLAHNGETTEADVLKRISPLVENVKNTLLCKLRKTVIVPTFEFSIKPFWANETGNERTDRKDFAQTRVHIIQAKLTINYRDNWVTPKK